MSANRTEPEKVTYIDQRRSTAAQGADDGIDRSVSRYLAFSGGSATCGKGIKQPFATLTAEAMELPYINLGYANGGVGAMTDDILGLTLCQNAQGCVVQVTSAHLLSNRLYSVHRRRNDRFLAASKILQRLYPTVDFTDFAFSRHLLSTLHQISAEKFEVVVKELRTAWMARMRRLLTSIGGHCVLLWLADHAPEDQHWAAHPAGLQADPLFVTRAMLDELRPLVRDVVIISREGSGDDIPAQPGWQVVGTGPRRIPGADVHFQVASALLPVLCGAAADGDRSRPLPRPCDASGL